MTTAINEFAATGQAERSRSVPQRSTRAASDEPRHGPTTSKDDLAVDDVAFEAVLALAQTINSVGTSGLGNASSPSQMFEAGGDQASDPQGTTQQATSPTTDSAEAQRYDRTSVDARIEASKAEPTQESTNRSRPSSEGIVRPGPPPTPGLPTDHPSSNRDCRIEDAKGTTADRRPPAPTVSVEQTHSPTPPTDGALPSGSSTLSLSAAGEIGATEAAVAPSAAQRVATILAGAKSGAAEAVRALAPGSSGHASTSTGSERSATPKETTNERAGNRATDPSNAKTESSARSLFDELVRSIRLRSGMRESSARIQLHPPELGRMDVDVKLINERVEILVRTENDAARHLVQARSMELMQAMQQHGIVIDRFDVAADAALPGFAKPQNDGGSETNDERREDASADTNAVAETHRAAAKGGITKNKVGKWNVAAEPRLDVSV